tara:strand:- start:1438 stop:2421 length:984 start_codon:yes stop_codon:yes gene_type:complete
MTDRIIESENKDGQVVSVKLKTPGPQEYRDSQIEYNRAFRSALDSGALLRQKLSEYMSEQGIWSDEKQLQNDKFIADITSREEKLKAGGIKLSEAKQIALELREVRAEFRDFLAERNSLDQNSAEGQADNARFSELVRLCMLNPKTSQPFHPTQADYDESSDQPWVIKAAGELAGMIYGLDPNYDNKLEENKFLKEFEFVNEDLRLVSDDGHLVDTEGNLIDENHRFIAYRTEEGRKNQDPEECYHVNRDGEEVIKIEEDGSWVKLSLTERKPFLDDDGEPVIVAKKEDAEEEKDLVSEDKVAVEESTPKPKRKRKTTKKETDSETS